MTDVSQPQADITLPENLQNEINAAKNSITVHNAEIMRLKGIETSLEYQVVELNKQVNELTTNVEKQTDDFIAGNMKLDRVKTSLDEAQKALDDVQEKITAKRKELADIEDNQRARESKIVSDTDMLDLALVDLKRRENTVQAREDAVLVRENKIKAFISSL